MRFSTTSSRGILARIGIGIVAMWLAFAALAQDAAPPQNGPSDTRPSDPAFRPGFIDAFGRFIGDSAATLNSQISHAHEALGDIGTQTGAAAKGAIDKAKGAADALIGLPNARIVSSREACTNAPNGAPDCRAAADTMCRAKGFAFGKSLDTQTTRNCPARVWLSGRFPNDSECALETFVTRAVCQ
jgi:hypothetical protein